MEPNVMPMEATSQRETWCEQLHKLEKAISNQLGVK
jgi:hypothetical protein